LVNGHVAAKLMCSTQVTTHVTYNSTAVRGLQNNWSQRRLSKTVITHIKNKTVLKVTINGYPAKSPLKK
jgi:hypothetical protein